LVFEVDVCRGGHPNEERGVSQMRTKADKREGGLKITKFLLSSFMDDPISTTTFDVEAHCQWTDRYIFIKDNIVINVVCTVKC